MSLTTLLLVDWLLLAIAVLFIWRIRVERKTHDAEMLDKATRLYRGALLR